MAGILDYFSQLFGGAQPAADGAQAAAPQAAPAQPQPQQDTQGMLAGLSPDQVNAMIAKARPGVLGTLMAGFSHPGGFNQVRDEVTKENIARALMPQQLALAQQGIAYGQSIKDPAMRELYFNDRPAYAKIMETRMGAHDTAAGAITTGLGANGDQAVNGSLVTKPGDAIGDVGGSVYRTNPQAPMAVPASNSVYDPSTKSFAQAPAEPKVVTTPAGSSSDVVFPGQPNQGGQTGAPGAGFNIGAVQKNPAGFFSLVLGKPVAISSGARTPQQNAAVGGVPNSAHLSDLAWDIPNVGLNAPQAAAKLKAAGVPFDQVIDEGDHLHVSLAPSARGMVLAGRNGQYQNLSGGSSPPRSGVQPIRQGQTPHQLVTPEERAAHGIAASDRAGYAVKPDGTIEKTADDDFGPDKRMAYTKAALEFEPLSDYIKARSYLESAKETLKQKGGYADLNLIEMAAKSANPTLAVRPNMIEAYGKERGWTDELIGKVRATMEHGQALDDAARNALYNTIYTNTQAHYNAAKGMIHKINRDAAKYGLTPQDLIPDLQEMPSAPSPSYGGNGSDQAIAAARDAIRRGAPRAAVIQRLRQNGINPAGL